MSLLDALLLDPPPFDVWIALRTDGTKGSGTQSDPYDGSRLPGSPLPLASLTNSGREVTANFAVGSYLEGDAVTIAHAGTGWDGSYAIYSVTATAFKFWLAAAPAGPAAANATASKLTFRFDDRMRDLTALPNTIMRIHIGPGTFETRGYAGAASGGKRPQIWQPKKGMNFIGSGIDVTILKIVFADVQGGNYYAISGDYNNLLDYVVVQDLTVDCNLTVPPSVPGQPYLLGQPLSGPTVATPGGFDYANVTCSAISLVGSYTRIRRVKAINWGAQTPSAEAFVLANGGAHPDLAEMVNPIIEDCICVAPNENNQMTATVIHTGGGGEGFDHRLGYSRGAILRRNFVDCAFSSGRDSFSFSAGQLTRSGATATCNPQPRKHNKVVNQRILVSPLPGGPDSPRWFGYWRVSRAGDPAMGDYSFDFGLDPANLPTETTYNGGVLIGTGFQALSMGATQGGIVEDNVVFNTLTGGPYQDTSDTREIIIRRNYYKNVGSGPNLTNGNVDRGTRKVALSLVSGTIAKATYNDLSDPANSSGHGYSKDEVIKISSASNVNYDRENLKITVVPDSVHFQFDLAPSTPTSDMGLAEDRGASISVLQHIGNRVAAATTLVPHTLQAGDRIKMSNSSKAQLDLTQRSDFNGFFEITQVPDVITFRYQMKSVPEANAIGYNATYQRVWGVKRLIIEDNLIELRQLYYYEFGTPTAIQLFDNLTILSPDGLPPFTHGEVVIRANTIRLVDGVTDPAFNAFGIVVTGAKRVLICDNIVDVPVIARPLRDARCGDVQYLNNRTAAGVLIQGANANPVTPVNRTDLEVEIDDAALLSI